MAEDDSRGVRMALVLPVRMTPAQAQAAGLKLERLWWGDILKGTAEALIAAGIVTRDQLPGVNPSLGRSAATFYRGEYVKSGHVRNDEHWLNVARSGKKYVVRIGVSKAEAERRSQASKQQAEAARERARQAQDAAIMSNPEKLREMALSMCEMLSWALANHTPGDHSRRAASFSCRFSPEGITDILDSLNEVHDWIRQATITAVDRAALKVEAARKDAAFQSFLAAQCLAGE